MGYTTFVLEMSWVPIFSLRSATLLLAVLIPLARNGTIPSVHDRFLPHS